MKTEKPVADGKITDEELGALTRRLDEIKRRLNDKTLNYKEVMKMLQIVIENKLTPDILNVLRGVNQITQITDVIDGNGEVSLGSQWAKAWHSSVGVINWSTVQIRMEVIIPDQGETVETLHGKWKGFKCLDINVFNFLQEAPRFIPEHWKASRRIIPFLGTLLFPLKKKSSPQCPLLTFDDNLEPIFMMWEKIPSNFEERIFLPHIVSYKKLPPTDKDSLLKRIFELEEIFIEAVDGSKIILNQTSLFGYNGNFDDHDLTAKASATEKTLVEMYKSTELISVGTLCNSFGLALEKISFTQHQIIDFVSAHANLLSSNIITYFLLKVDEEYRVEDYYYLIGIVKKGQGFAVDPIPFNAGHLVSSTDSPCFVFPKIST